MIFARRIYYYSVENSYIYLPKEDTYAACRGPQFTPCYDRYDKAGKSSFGVTGMAVLVPKTEAAGKPWVFRADRIGPDASALDLALLAKGYYIVAAPILGGGPVRAEWDAAYKNMTDHGFSKKPAMMYVKLLIAANEKLLADAAKARELAGEVNDAESQDLMIGRITLH